MKSAIRDAGELCRRLQLPLDPGVSPRASRQFPVFAPLAYVAKMRIGDPRDPLLRQVLPLVDEEDEHPGYSRDPVGESGAVVAPGMLQKYAGRVLLVTTGACAIHCRYCFRRHFPYHDGPQSIAQWEPALARIREDASIEEVLLSGGDPLTVTDPVLGVLMQRLASIAHVRRVRIHTRLPIVIPDRVTSELLDQLLATRLQVWMVVHANHPRELDDEVGEALSRMQGRGLVTLNQSVLLRGVNDDADVLCRLSRRLLELRVVPYYLHQLDPVAGTAHFAVERARGQGLMDSMRAALPGYAVPRYVEEIPGAASKREIRD